MFDYIQLNIFFSSLNWFEYTGTGSTEYDTITAVIHMDFVTYSLTLYVLNT